MNISSALDRSPGGTGVCIGCKIVGMGQRRKRQLKRRNDKVDPLKWAEEIREEAQKMRLLALSMNLQAAEGITRALQSRHSALLGLERARQIPASERFWKRAC